MTQWFYAPVQVMIFGAGLCAVKKSVTHLPGQHPKNSPIRKDLTALELITDRGSRWFGVESAKINSELKMVVTGGPLDAEKLGWEHCTII